VICEFGFHFLLILEQNQPKKTTVMKQKSLIFFIVFVLYFQCKAQTWTTYNATNNFNTVTSFLNKIHCITIDDQNLKWVGAEFTGTQSGSTFNYNDTSATHFIQIQIGAGVVTSITVDSQGNTWFGLQNNGITKYDGVNFMRYSQFYSGLPSNWIKCSAEDSSGNMWFGTISGLTKFDGTNWTNYSTSDGLANNYITDIEVDGQGNVWFGTAIGLTKFDGNNWTSYTTSNTANGLISNNIRSLAIDSNGDLIIGTLLGLCIFDGINWSSFTSADGLIDNAITCITIDNEGNKWIGTASGVSLFNGVDFTNYTTSQGLVHNEVLCIAVDQQGAIWFGGSYGVTKFNGLDWYYFGSLTHEWINCIATDREGYKWFGTILGLSTYNGESWRTYVGLGAVNCVSEDYAGNKWLGQNYGLIKIDSLNTMTYYSTSNGLVGNEITKIIPDPTGGIWCITPQGVSRFDGTLWTTYDWNYTNAIDSNVVDMAIDAQGNRWFIRNKINDWGTSKLCKFDGVNWTSYEPLGGFVNENNYLRCISIDQDGDKWIGTDFHLLKFDNTNWTEYPIASSSCSACGVNDIAVDGDNNKWLATGAGLRKFDGENWTIYTTLDGLVDNELNQIEIDQLGDKWIGSFLHGVSQFSDGGVGPLSIYSNCVGLVFNDLNGNGIRESGEPSISQQIIQIDESYTTNMGNGLFYSALTNGNHTFQYRAPLHWEMTTADSLTVNSSNFADTITFGIGVATFYNT
jgi:ligand-binding sensor domain-containing protein